MRQLINESVSKLREHRVEKAGASSSDAVVRRFAVGSRPRNGERGQAVAEMCISLMAIMVVFLGIIVLAGLGISNIRILMDAKNQAEANRSRPPLEGLRDIFAWHYGSDIDVDGDGVPEVYALPFDADDTPIYVVEYTAQAVFESQLNSPQYSASANFIPGQSGYYDFSPVSAVDSASSYNFARNMPGLFAAAAGLVSSQSYIADDIFTLRENDFNSREQLNAVREAFRRLFGVDIGTFDLRNMPANRVYLPSMHGRNR